VPRPSAPAPRRAPGFTLWATDLRIAAPPCPTAPCRPVASPEGNTLVLEVPEQRTARDDDRFQVRICQRARGAGAKEAGPTASRWCRRLRGRCRCRALARRAHLRSRLGNSTGCSCGTAAALWLPAATRAGMTGASCAPHRMGAGSSSHGDADSCERGREPLLQRPRSPSLQSGGSPPRLARSHRNKRGPLLSHDDPLHAHRPAP